MLISSRNAENEGARTIHAVGLQGLSSMVFDFLFYDSTFVVNIYAFKKC